MTSEIKISCIIIGHNSAPNLEQLLTSIVQQNYTNNDIEIIYVDNGSSDDSLKVFHNHPVQYLKKAVSLSKNIGRMQARLEGVKHAKGTWCLFTNSNIVFKYNIIYEYNNIIQTSKSSGYSGIVKYDSKDQFFTKYLNNKNRGSNNLKHLDFVPFYNVLFSNCIIQTKVMTTIIWNKKFIGYGGEELDFFFLLHAQQSKIIQLCETAIAFRNNHPSYDLHCKRLYEFGFNNFKELEFSLQTLIVKNKFFLRKILFFKFFLKIITMIIMATYKTKFKKLNFFLIKLGMWSSILLGYHKSK